MQIAIFTDSYLDLTGGIVTSINAQKAELERRGHTVYVFSSSYPKTPREKQRLAKNHIFPVPSCKLIGRGLTPIAKNPYAIKKWLLKNHPELADFDVFYIHYEAGCSIAGLYLAKSFHKPSVQVMHGREDMGEVLLVPMGFRTLVAVMLSFIHSWYLPHPVKVRRDNFLAPTIARAKMWTLMINHANAADLVLTPSNHFREKLQHYGVTRPIKVFPNAVSDALFIDHLAPRTLAPGESLRLIWHSRISGEKRPLVFLDALTRLQLPYHVDMYGSGLELFRAKRYARRHHLHVTFHGIRPFAKIYAAILKAHLDVLISNGSDTFGMTLIEAESAGTPVLYVDTDMSEIVPPGAGLVSQGPDATAIAAAINTLKNRPDLIAKMSAKMLAHRDATRISRVMDELEGYFRDIIGS